MPATSTLLDDRYLLVEPIGVGGFSEVWRAHDRVLDRPVAVKLLHSGFAAHSETLHRFRAEARHAGALAHQNIARVYDYGDPRPEHPPYLVLELIDGDSLAHVLRTSGPMDAARAMDITAQAAAGLEAAHQAGLVHRDVKPANLLLSPAGVVKITDFGISYAAGSAPMTRTGMIVGTPAYLAPERTSGAQATRASDLYSLGVLGYECLTGTPPFAGTAIEVALAHRERPFPALPASVPAAVAGFIAELTAKDPAVRPASAAEVAASASRLRDQLRRANHGASPASQPIAAGLFDAPVPTALLPQPLLPQPPFRRRLGRRTAFGLAGSAAVIALIVLIGVNLLGASPPRHAPGSPRARVTRVDVNSRALTGLPVGVAAGMLRQLHLLVRIQWVTPDRHGGRVVAVVPAGRVRVGGLVTIIGAASSPGHGHDHGHGHGHGDNGDGGGQGD